MLGETDEAKAQHLEKQVSRDYLFVRLKPIIYFLYLLLLLLRYFIFPLLSPCFSTTSFSLFSSSLLSNSRALPFCFHPCFIPGFLGLYSSIECISSALFPHFLHLIAYPHLSQVVELWDRVYQAWVSAHPTPPTSPKVTSEAVALSFDTLVDGLRKTSGRLRFCECLISMTVFLFLRK